jgi:hypothetical protein
VQIHSVSLHYWIGSFCHVIDSHNNNNNKKFSFFPNGVVAVSDIITLIEDIGNNIPERSWMLYVLELFNVENIAVELNLICSFNNDGKFNAIFNGINQYQFKEILPIVGHSYLRQIILNSSEQCISYILQDQNNIQTERFDLHLRGQSFGYEASNQFTGIEWWNRIGNYPYPIRYTVEFSQLMFGLGDPTDKESITYMPHKALRPNTDGSATKYPISFHNIRIKDDCISYKVRVGECYNGMRYKC